MNADTRETERTEMQLGQLLPVYLGQWAYCVCVEKSHQKLVASLVCRPGWLQIRPSLHCCSRHYRVIFHVDLMTLFSAVLSPLQRDTKTHPNFNLHNVATMGTLQLSVAVR